MVMVKVALPWQPRRPLCERVGSRSSVLHVEASPWFAGFGCHDNAVPESSAPFFVATALVAPPPPFPTEFSTPQESPCSGESQRIYCILISKQLIFAKIIKLIFRENHQNFRNTQFPAIFSYHKNLKQKKTEKNFPLDNNNNNNNGDWINICHLFDRWRTKAATATTTFAVSSCPIWQQRECHGPFASCAKTPWSFTIATRS